MPLSKEDLGLNSIRQTATRSALNVDDSASLLLGKSAGIRAAQNSKIPFRQKFSKLATDDKQEPSEFAGEQWHRDERYQYPPA